MKYFSTPVLRTENEFSFRIMSYNILADTYADSDYSKDVLFPYCPTYALDMDYRKQLILKEIIGKCCPPKVIYMLIIVLFKIYSFYSKYPITKM